MIDNKNTVKLPGGQTGFVTTGDAAEQQKLIDARWAFTLQYMADKGWGSDIEKLSISQILEINDQDGWKNPQL